MKKLVTLIAALLAVPTSSALDAHAEPDSTTKRAVAMTSSTLHLAPLAVLRSTTRVVPMARPSAALIRKKAQTGYPSTHYSKGLYFKSKGKTDIALVEFLRATQENPRTVRAFYEQALIFRDKHFAKLAESALEQALAVKPDYQEAKMLLVTVRIEQGNVGGAMAVLSRSLGLPSGDAAPKASSIPKTVDQILAKAPAVLQSLHDILTDLPTYLFAAPTAPAASTAALESVNPGSVNKAEIEANQESKGINDKSNAQTDNQTDTKQTAGESVAKNDGEPTPEHKSGRKKWQKKERNAIKFFHRKPRQDDETVEPVIPLSSYTGQPSDKSPSTGAGADIKQSLDNGVLQSNSQSREPREKPGTSYGDTVAVAPDAAGRYRRVTVSNLPFEPADPAEAPRNEPPSESRHDTIAFQIPKLPSAMSAMMAPLTRAHDQQAAEQSSDEWTVRLKYLAEHGTASLKDGEAFMFSEDSGEAAIFLADGRSIRRKIMDARDEKEVVRERRPDILIPDELMYNLSLLGKLMPHASEAEQNQAARQAAGQSSSIQTQAQPPPGPTFDLNNLMGDSQGFWGWMKHVLKL